MSGRAPSFVGGSYDDAQRRGLSRCAAPTAASAHVRPRHLVFATGVSSIPFTPDLPGLKDFAGAVSHSGAFDHPERWKGRKALVLGTGTSGHDVAQELHTCGADVTIIQRSKTYVVSLPEAQSVYAIYQEGIPFEDCDLLATSFPYPVLQRSYQLSTAKSREVDRAAARRAGEAPASACTFGEDDTGFQMMYLRRGGGYYFNVGCSELIISGAVKLLQFADIERFVAQGARLKDGRVVPADLLVLATGYLSQQDAVRHFLGDAIADRIGPVWGFDEGGELRNMWRRTAQAGPLVHRRQPGAMPHLLALSRAADQGDRGRHHRLGAEPLLPQPPENAFQPTPIDRPARYDHQTPTGTAMTCTASRPRPRPNSGACTCAAVLAAAGPPSRVCRMTKNELIATGKKANRPDANEPIE